MDVLSDLIVAAAAAVPPEYFQLPIHGADPVYRERVYCYELYHQMRLRWPAASPYRLNGEIDKRSHPYFADGGSPKPDLLVHEPGTGRNYAILEVKSRNASADGTAKDLATLWRFRREFGYERAIYLIYGTVPDDAWAKLQRCGNADQLGVIELWVHLEPGTPAFRIDQVLAGTAR